MDKATEIKSRLSVCLKAPASGFDEFRVWFADALRTSRRFDEETQNLIWAIDFAFARFGLGKWSLNQLQTYLRRLAGPEDYAVEIQPSDAVETASSNHPQVLAAVAFAGQQVEIGPAVISG
jgi:hypothetical protein